MRTDASMESPAPHSTSARHARDLDFARRVLASDPIAIEELARRLECLPAMVRYQSRILGARLDEHEVEEVVRETTLAMWRKLPRFEGRSTLETWAFRFAMLEVLKAMQASAKRPRELPDTHAEENADEPEAPPFPFEAGDLAAGLEQLSTGAAEVIRLRHWDELPFETIAERVGLPLNTVKARYYRGLARLREILERRERRT